jgi:hypothetical protein
LFGERTTRVAGRLQLLLLIVAICGRWLFFRHHEKELVQRADLLFAGPGGFGIRIVIALSRTP